MTARTPDTLAEEERVCLHCTLPDCDETDPGCLWRKPEPRPALKYGALLAKTKALERGETFRTECKNREVLERVQDNLGYHRQVGHIPGDVHTWTTMVGSSYYLNIAR